MNIDVEIFRAEGLPVLQNRTYSSHSEARACVKGDVVLVQHPRTGLIYNAAFDPRRIAYDASYNNEQGGSSAFREHLEQVAEMIDAHLHGCSLIEIGCGKGSFLEMLQMRGYTITGIDPAYDGSNPAIVKGLFSPDSNCKAEGIVLRHVLEHIPDPYGFLNELRYANGGRGIIYIEVPCFDWIAENRTWFDIFYEHVNYFRLSDFDRLFGRVIDSRRTFGGQYLSVMADLSTLHAPASASTFMPLRSDFSQGIVSQAQRLRDRLAQGRPPAVIWGAASKGVIFAIYMERHGILFEHAIDINQSKQGRYLPGTGVLVLSPHEALSILPKYSDIIVVNPNYLGEVRDFAGDGFLFSSL